MTEHEIRQAFHRHFSTAGNPIIVSAPGRVNLIGEHTDYNDGFVLPMAIDDRILLAGTLRDDLEVHLYSDDFQASSTFSLENITHSQDQPWSNYLRGVCSMFLESTSLSGMNILLQGNIPQGAGLSSSAALEVGAALLIRNLNNLSTSLIELVKLAQRAENQFVGVQCGIMDQFISALGKRAHVLFLDCRSLEYKLVQAPFAEHNACIIVVDSGVKRGLVDSEYNLRRQQCDQAVTELRKRLPHIKSLRDVNVDNLTQVNTLEEDLKRRARHIVTENRRVLDATKWLQTGDLQKFGKLMIASHISLRDDYQVSCDELDLLVELALTIPGVYGSRMTGAGFGGCTVSLVDQASINRFKEKVNATYPQKTALTPRIYIYNPSDGVKQL